MTTNVGPQQVQSDIYASSLYDELEVLNIINATNKDIIAVINKGKDMERRDISVRGGDIIRKYNNKEKGEPFINYNS